MIADILSAGGSLTVDPSTDKERHRVDALIRAARKSSKLPPGTQLLVDRATWSKRHLTIEALPAWMSATLTPIQVSSQLRNPHAAIVTLRDAERLLPIVGPPRNRALRLLQALVVASEARGYKAKAVTSRVDQYGRHERHPLQLQFKVRGHDVGLQISQENDRADHVPTAKELAEKARYEYTRIPKYDYTPSDRLKIEIPGMYEHRQSTWADGPRGQLEDRLPEILQEIELRSDATERARLAAEERKRQEILEHERRVERANVQLVESNRATVLERQLDDWLTARNLATYLDAMASVVEQLEDPLAAAAAREWLGWARQRAKKLNPLGGRLAMPPDPEPTYAALEPFMERTRGVFGW